MGMRFFFFFFLRGKEFFLIFHFSFQGMGQVGRWGGLWCSVDYAGVQNESTGGDWNLVVITHAHTESWITYQGCIIRYLSRYVHVCHTVYSLDKRDIMVALLCKHSRSALPTQLVSDIWLLFLSHFVTPSVERVEHIMYLVYRSFNLQNAYPLCCECFFSWTMQWLVMKFGSIYLCFIYYMAWNTRT